MTRTLAESSDGANKITAKAWWPFLSSHNLRNAVSQIFAGGPDGDVQGGPDPKAASSSAVKVLRAVDTLKLVYQGDFMRLSWAGMLTHTAGDARVSPWGVPTRCGW